MIRRLLKPAMDIAHRIAVQFLKYWRGAPLPSQIGSFPVALVSMIFIGIYTYLYGCRS